MFFITFPATVIALLSLTVKADEISGNLGLCISSSISLDGEECMDSKDGVLKPSLWPANDAGEKTLEAWPPLNWTYDNGLLRNEDGLCLGPRVQSLGLTNTIPYDLALQDCPSGDDTVVPAFDGPSYEMTQSRHMRYLITNSGQIQSLATVISPQTGKDVVKSSPFCLSMIEGSVEDDGSLGLPFLVPCRQNPEESDPVFVGGRSWDVHQFFDVYGTYSDSFLIPLGFIFDFDENVEIAYQVGLPGASDGNDETPEPDFEINVVWLLHGIDHQLLDAWIVENIPVGKSPAGGIVSFDPSDQNVSGSLSAFLRVVDEFGSLNEATFIVTNLGGIVGKGPNGNYEIFTILLGCLVGCFLLSVVLEKICGKKTRSEDDGTNDGKTVCLETEDQEFPLDDDPEEGRNVITVHKPNNDSDDDTSDIDTDLDESRNSRSIELASIGREQDLPQTDDE